MRTLLAISCVLLTTCSPSGELVVSEPQQQNESKLGRGCEKLRREYREDEWDEVTETYPTNYEWERCMGVRL
jgi:hypothetical protein